MSTPSFIKYLTDLSFVILGADNKLKTLKNELRQLNLKLPATVYIPFVSGNLFSYKLDGTRNNIVLNIPPREAKVFITKTKAPYMICLELYDPLEIIDDPLVLEPSQNEDYLSSPDMVPRMLKRRKTVKKLIPTQSILVLGTLPRNVVDLKLLQKKGDRNQKDEDDIITIAKSNIERARRQILRKQSTRRNCISGLILKKHQSIAIDAPKWIRKGTMKFSSNNLLSSLVQQEISPENENSFKLPICPVLVAQDDVVIRRHKVLDCSSRE